MGLATQLYFAMNPFVSDEDPLDSASSAHAHATKNNATPRRSICLNLAIRLHRHGEFPKSLDELSIDKNLQLDPYSPNGALFKYSANETGYLLYSVGPDGVDDSGTPMKTAYGEGDYLPQSLADFGRK